MHDARLGRWPGATFSGVGTMTKWIWRGVALAAALAVIGCGAPSGLGANAGGAQDLGFARELIDAGVVPPQDAWPPEGIYAEHDLPLEGPPCDEVLCVRAAAAIAEDLVAQEQGIFVQLGLSSGIDAATFHRRPQNLALVIDQSGSMGEGDRMASVREAALELVDKLGEGDLLTVVMFDEVATHLIGPAAVVDREAFKAKIRTIQPDGSTCIECGLKMGFERITARQDATRDTRVLLFTDALPNVGATGDGEFMELLASHAQQQRYVTVFGVGYDFGQALITKITSVRGANYVFLRDEEQTRKVFSEDFDFLLTPIAHDLKLNVTPAEGVTFQGAYGIPGVDAADTQASSTVKTVFLSRRKGAIVVRLDGTPQPGSSLATVALTYQRLDGTTYSAELLARFEGEATPWYSSPGVRKTVVLTNFVVTAKEVSRLYHASEREKATALANRLADYMRTQAEALNDAGVSAEAAVAEALAELVAAGVTG